MTVIFVNRFFHPDYSATAQMLSDLVFALSARGHDVMVLTSRLQYERPNVALPAQETIGGVRVVRVWTTRFGRSHLPGRVLDYLTFYLSATVALLRQLRSQDVVVAMTDPPMLAVPLGWVVRRRRAHLVNWLQDLFPEIAIEAGLRLLRSPLGSSLQRWRDASLRRANLNVVLGEVMAEHVRALGVAERRVTVISNWADDRVLAPIDPADNELRRAWGLEGKVVVGYSGNLGRVHDYETLLRASAVLSDRADLVFLFIGGGYLWSDLQARVEGLGDSRFVFKPYQERGRLGESLSAADIHWTSLRPEFEGLIVPSKVYGIAAVGRPILHVGDPEGEIGRLVLRHGCGRAVEQGDAQGLAAVIADWAADESLRRKLGANARQMIDGGLSFEARLGAWETALMDVAAS